MKIFLKIIIIAGLLYSEPLNAVNTINNDKINVILIMADDLGYECLGCNGGLSYNTPNLDEMAAKGMRFEHCYSQPLCTPSRVKLMTGKYNYRNYEGFEYLNPEEKTFGNIMKKAGYATCIVGKWQLNGIHGYGTELKTWPGSDDKSRPHTFGFEEYCLWQLTDRQSRYANPLIEQNGKTLTGLEDAYGPDVFCDYAIDFIERKKDQAFFLYYPLVLPHSPFVPTPDSEEWKFKEKRNVRDETYFKDMVEYIDKLVGRIIQKTEDEGIADHTLILFTGDNGTHKSIVSVTRAGSYPGGKGKMYDAGTHVPLIAYWPGQIKSSSLFEGLIDFSDFMPTFADIAGMKVESDGKSYYSLLKGESYNEKEIVFVHYDLRLGPGKHDYHDRFARTKEYKLYQDGRFYHIPTDKWEENPLPEERRISWDVLSIRQRLWDVIDSAPEWEK